MLSCVQFYVYVQMLRYKIRKRAIDFCVLNEATKEVLKRSVKTSWFLDRSFFIAQTNISSELTKISKI